MPDRYATWPERYKGRPFLKFVDSWVLWVLGVLDADSERRITEMTPKLLQTFGMESGTWQEIVETQMEFGPEWPDSIRAKWMRQVDRDLDDGRTPDPLAWAHAFVDFVTRDEDQPTS